MGKGLLQRPPSEQKDSLFFRRIISANCSWKILERVCEPLDSICHMFLLPTRCIGWLLRCHDSVKCLSKGCPCFRTLDWLLSSNLLQTRCQKSPFWPLYIKSNRSKLFDETVMHCYERSVCFTVTPYWATLFAGEAFFRLEALHTQKKKIMSKGLHSAQTSLPTSIQTLLGHLGAFLINSSFRCDFLYLTGPLEISTIQSSTVRVCGVQRSGKETLCVW